MVKGRGFCSDIKIQKKLNIKRYRKVKQKINRTTMVCRVGLAAGPGGGGQQHVQQLPAQADCQK